MGRRTRRERACTPGGALSTDVLQLLCQVHDRVRRGVQDARVLAEPPVGTNAKGDTQQRFDVVADAIIRQAVTESVDSGILLSEESGEVRFGEHPPIYRFIVDPVDGSDNWGRGLPLSAVSIAVLPVDAPLQPDRVSWAMVGELREPLPLTAGRGQGAYRGSHRVRVSHVRTLQSAFLSCELNHFDPTPAVGRLFRRARAVRTYGCASQAITLVATGALDVHVDVRRRLTAESFLAAALVLEEAGGCVLTGDGHPIRQLDSLVARTSLVAAATPELAHEVIDALDG